MTETPRRRPTRGYVWGVIAAVVILATALITASWGILSVMIGRTPVTTRGIGLYAAELIVGLLLLSLAWGLWNQALAYLRGRRALSWSAVVVLAGGAYLAWSLLGMAVGMQMQDTWLSPFALALAIIWAVCSIVFWVVLVRRIYTDRPVPQWPWERRGEPGPDWNPPPDGSRGEDDPESGAER